MKRATLVAFALMLGGCGSYKSDLYKICNAIELSGAPPGSGLSSAAPWLSKNLRTEKSRDLLRSIGSTGSIDTFRLEVEANGIQPCPILDALPH